MEHPRRTTKQRGNEQTVRSSPTACLSVGWIAKLSIVSVMLLGTACAKDAPTGGEQAVSITVAPRATWAPLVQTIIIDGSPNSLCRIAWCGWDSNSPDVSIGVPADQSPGGGSGGGSNAPVTDSYAFWSLWAHNTLLDHAFPTKCSNVVVQFKYASAVEDLFHTKDNRRHYLRDSLTAPTAARNAADQWILEKLRSAEQLAATGQWTAAYMELGRAMHGITDKTSPVHRDEFGLPNVYPVPDGVVDQHTLVPWGGAERKADITASMFALNDTNLNNAYNRITAYAAARGHSEPPCGQ